MLSVHFPKKSGIFPRTAWWWLLPICLCLAAPGLLAEGVADGRLLECQAKSGAQSFSWQVSLDASRSMALVDKKEIVAEYSSSHVRIPLAAEGRALFIGRISGRLVVSTLEGITVASGKCRPLVEI